MSLLRTSRNLVLAARADPAGAIRARPAGASRHLVRALGALRHWLTLPPKDFANGLEVMQAYAPSRWGGRVVYENAIGKPAAEP